MSNRVASRQLMEPVVSQETPRAALDVIQKFLVLYRHMRRYARKAQCEGVRGRELALIRYLHEVGRLNVGQICDYLFLSPSSTSELVSRLEKAGFLERRRSKSDSRVVWVQLTPHGAEIARQPPTGGIPLLRERIKALPTEQLAPLNGSLATLIEIMEINPDDFT